MDTHQILATEDTHHPHIADPMATLAIIHPLPILHPKDGPVHPVMVAHPPTVVHPQETTGKATMAHAQATHQVVILVVLQVVILVVILVVLQVAHQVHLRVRQHLHLQHRRVLLVHLLVQDRQVVHPPVHLANPHMDPHLDPIMISIR